MQYCYKKGDADSRYTAFDTAEELAAFLCTNSSPGDFRAFKDFTYIVDLLKMPLQASSVLFMDRDWIPYEGTVWVTSLDLRVNVVDVDSDEDRPEGDDSLQPLCDVLHRQQDAVPVVSRTKQSRRMGGRAADPCYIVDSQHATILTFESVVDAADRLGISAPSIYTSRKFQRYFLGRRFLCTPDRSSAEAELARLERVEARKEEARKRISSEEPRPAPPKTSAATPVVPPTRRAPRKVSLVRFFTDNGARPHASFTSVARAADGMKLDRSFLNDLIYHAEPNTLIHITKRPQFHMKVEF